MGGKPRPATRTHDDEDLHNFEDDEEDYSSDFEGNDGEAAMVRDNDGDDNPVMDEDGQLRLRADIALDGENYAGKKSSRKAALEEDELQLDDADGAELSERLRVAYSDGSLDEDGERPSTGSLLFGAQDDELEALSREYEQLREEEEKGLEILRGQEKDNHRKGQAVRHQKALWDRYLEVRISLQKMLAIANRLPMKQVKVSMCHENEQIKEAYTELTDSAMRTLNCLLDLETVVIEKNSTITESYSSIPNASEKRETFEEAEGETLSDRAWKNLDELYSKLVPYRDNALDRWQRKTQIYAGAVGKVKLRAFNQSVSQQVATTMRDSSRLIARTRLKSGAVNVLGQPVQQKAKTNVSTNIEKDVEFLRPANAIEDDVDPETFDDSEFYQQLLREFLESSDPSALGSMSLYATARQHNKKRKKVDRRASKGRKLRYDVFDPLLNFMAPKPMVIPPMATHLFSNLFGHKSIVSSSAS